MLGNIHSIETFGSADGPGVRYLIFLKGCNMRCKYCHNPDTWAKTEGEMKSAEEILQQALRYKRYWGKKGGITVPVHPAHGKQSHCARLPALSVWKSFPD